MTIANFVLAVHTYCWLFDASVTSWFRSVARNRALGGVPYSAHVFGLAVDVVYDSTPTVTERHNWGSRLGLRVIVEDDHDHLQPLDWQAG